MRFIKGASLKGIVGISPVRSDGRLKVIRPLIELEKAEIVQYLEKFGLAEKMAQSHGFGP